MIILPGGESTSSGSSIARIRGFGCIGNNDGENGWDDGCCWIFSFRLYVGERCGVCWLDVFVELDFRLRDGTVFERRWDTDDDAGRYKTSILLRIFNGRFCSLWNDGEGFSICNVKKREVEPTTDDNDEPLTISIGLTRFKNKN